MIKPTANNVLIRQIREKQTASGIILAEDSQERSRIAEVVAVGPDVSAVAVGDKVIIDLGAGCEISDKDGVVETMVYETDILAVVEE